MKVLNAIGQVWPRGLDMQEMAEDGKHVAVRVFEAVKMTVLCGGGEKFESHTLATDETEEEVLDKAIPPSMEDKKSEKREPGSKEELKKVMELGSGKEVTEEVVNICWDNKELFGPVQPGSVKNHNHKIELNTEKDVKARVYKLQSDQRDAAEAEITNLLKLGMIKEVKQSQFQAPIVVVKKKSTDGKVKWRLCVDFRLLNSHTVKDSYPMPSLEEQLNVGDAKWFTKIDLSSAFWQIPLAESDQLKTTFHFEGRSYVWLVMPFGLRNAPPTFQRLMDKTLAGLIGKGVYSYIDDILIYAKTKEEHNKLLKKRVKGITR